VHIFKGAFVSHKFFPSILLAFALFAFPAFAQTGATPKIAAPATNNADALTPDQAKRALDTLQDDKKRAQMIDTLRAIANASPQAQAAPTVPEPQPAVPLTADSLGAQLLLTVSEQVGEISHEIAGIARTLTPNCIDGVSVWRAPGSRWSDCRWYWDVSHSSCSQCSSSSVSPRCCWVPRSAISQLAGL